MTSEKKLQIGNDIYKRWLKNLDNATRVKIMTNLSKDLAAKGVHRFKISEALVQLSQRCLVMLDTLSYKEIKRLTRCRNKKKYMTNNKGRGGKKEHTKKKDNTERINKKFQELFGDDFIDEDVDSKQTQKDACMINDEQWNEMGYPSPYQSAKLILNNRGVEAPLPLEVACDALISETPSTDIQNSRDEDSSKGMVSPRPRIGSIRVKNIQTMTNTDNIIANPMPDKGQSASIFYEEYIYHFNEQVKVSVLKLGELLWLAVADYIQMKDRIERARQLSSNDLISEEMKRAELNFSTLIQIRGNEFAPLFLDIFETFSATGRRTLFVALFCQILHHAMSFNADSSPTGTGESYIMLAQDVTLLMISNHQKSGKDIFHDLQFESTNFEAHVRILYKIMFPHDEGINKNTEEAHRRIGDNDTLHEKLDVAIRQVKISPASHSALASLSPAASQPPKSLWPETTLKDKGPLISHVPLCDVNSQHNQSITQTLVQPIVSKTPSHPPNLSIFSHNVNSHNIQGIPHTITTQSLTSARQVFSKPSSCKPPSKSPNMSLPSYNVDAHKMQSIPHTISTQLAPESQHITSKSPPLPPNLPLPSYYEISQNTPSNIRNPYLIKSDSQTTSTQLTATAQHTGLKTPPDISNLKRPYVNVETQHTKRISQSISYQQAVAGKQNAFIPHLAQPSHILDLNKIKSVPRTISSQKKVTTHQIVSKTPSHQTNLSLSNDKAISQDILSIPTQLPLAAKHVSVPGTPYLTQPSHVVNPHRIESVPQSHSTTSAIQIGHIHHFNATTQPLTTPSLNANPQHISLVPYLAQPSNSVNSQQLQSVNQTISTKSIVTAQHIVTKASSQQPNLHQTYYGLNPQNTRTNPQLAPAKQIVSMPSVTHTLTQANSPQKIETVLNINQNRIFHGPRKAQRATSLTTQLRTSQERPFLWNAISQRNAISGEHNKYYHIFRNNY